VEESGKNKKCLFMIVEKGIGNFRKRILEIYDFRKRNRKF
jgi:hypothetical protein